MDFRGMLCTYLDVKETRNILRGMHMPAQGSKKDLVVELMRRLGSAPPTQASRMKGEFIGRMFETVNGSSIKKILEDEGLPSSGTREELLERLAYCVMDSDEEMGDILPQH